MGWSTTRRKAALAAQVLALLCLIAPGAGCAGRGKYRKPGRRARLVWVDQPGAGRVATCPDDAIDAYGDGTPSPMDTKCSYVDAMGEGMTQIRGRVLAEPSPGQLGEPVAGATIVVHQLPRAGKREGPGVGLGPQVARAQADAQGTFVLSAMLPAGEYVVVVPGAAERRLTLTGQGAREISDFTLVLPRPQTAPP